MAQHQSSITPFLISPPNVPPNEDSIQPVRKKKKISRKKTSWIWEHFIEGHTDNDEPAIICQVEKENGTKCNVKLKHDSSGISHLWSIHKMTNNGKQPDKQQKLNVTEKYSEAQQDRLRQFLDAAKTSKYLNAIADVSTRWYSSYLAWRHLTKLKGYIKGLVNHLELESDPDSRKDAKLLKNIMISDDEWSLILDLTEILSHFADATNYLGESKYCTYSSMNPTIIEIMKWVRPSSSNNGLTDIDVDRINDAFGEVSELEKDREINTPVDTYDLLDQIKKILYGALIHYFNPTSSEALLAALLDPRFKNLHLFTQNQKQDAIDELQNSADLFYPDTSRIQTL
ncbi:hypothetical protein GLOIN_2v1482909 [Rhizophagus irregularis DAOM 181602=DAOM 197198]|uniref:Uncharacterized protein n=1 Tax=Rhizophagus irregularis (strain DAOM 181602 / DAOM 197198 / MUCL 43194) TaxID=747089 RepID=A0A2P4PK32_RHIID|nr:hypothetical protein GLOIN_2v1482909 [Rhizophagus irregularis DAOM 181602=DAOM 197198]POG65753.1 hypothetical protein GLOIN_2v1482909 [Rhizophagus irregularis DAOM 181602=DAOM 197198]|eukprot:XP_025172619.1 hypothetical protein GLOIN_2v1482909 [Rhizophagus irregularis DAOM 181602=DAOM 197198]